MNPYHLTDVPTTVKDQGVLQLEYDPLDFEVGFSVKNGRPTRFRGVGLGSFVSVRIVHTVRFPNL